MWKSACVGVYQLLNWKMHGETLKFGFSWNFIFEDSSKSVEITQVSSKADKI